MTLLRELALYLTLLLILLFAGSFVLTVNDARHYLQEQLNSHAQDTATSLGIAIASAGTGNSAAMDSMIDAVFDRGYYRQIRFTDRSGKILVNNEHPIALEGVPDWFVKLIDLEAPEVTSEINSGWVPMGQLLVASHPGHAYRSLWSKVSGDALLFSFGLILAMVGLNTLLGVVLRPLKKMEHQANRICERHFEIQPELPKTRDLRRVVQAMNRMAEKLDNAFSEQVALIEELRRKLVKDPLTGLLNRKAFERRMNTVLSEDIGEAGGGLILIQVRGLEMLNRCHGQKFVDDLLLTTSYWVGKTLLPWPAAFAGRRNGSSFTVFVPACRVSEVRKVTELLFKALVTMEFFASPEGSNNLHIAAVTHQGRCSTALLLDHGDKQLLEQEIRVKNCWDVTDISGESGYPYMGWSDTHWVEALEKVMSEGLIELYGQPIMGADGAVACTEILVRITLDGEVVSADSFMPVVERYDLYGKFDRAVFFALADYMDDRDDYRTYCLNISPYSLLDDDFYHWLLDALKLRQDLARRLILETAERSLMLVGERVAERVDKLVATGCQFSIDHFGVSSQALTFLQMMNTHYLKVDGSFTRDLTASYENQLYIRTLAMLAESRDIGVLAQGVENKEAWEALKQLGVTGGQGYYLGHPELLV
ncbi:EAL domain-containing protein [Endozoicomonas sp. SCSIO W0465]|uniref:EAL domain-containing protein n=1 Tax=Endozoicomonas sp. SCSIO W0465 TaxID=2918516 RepID=UPI002075F2CC|nr:EAL domain-containing protein [Endozoicomonas sp. SCSIO W0465]USE37731.1 EAL domain-containing protein [Endozoicomonas sp. SCSIO W0465]